MNFPDEHEPSPPQDVDRTMIRKFREQIHALGALWIFIGSLSSAVASYALQNGPDPTARIMIGSEQRVFLVVLAGLGLTWLVLGVLTCLKQMWAVYVALALSYLSMVGQILNLNICGGIIIILVILQAHRVIGWAKEMRAAGLPLTAKPR